MPAVAAVGAVLIALMALLVIYGLEQLGKIVAHIFPDHIGVSVATIHPRAWVESGVAALAGLAKWIVGDVIRPVINFILGPIGTVIHWAARITNFASAVAIEMDWLVNNGIPQAVDRLRHYSHSLFTAAEAYAAAKVADLHHVLFAQIDNVRAWASGIVADVHAYALHIVTDARQYTRDLIDGVRGDLASGVKAAEAFATTAVAAATAKLEAEVASVAKLATGELATAASYTDGAVSDAVRALTADITVATAAVIQVVDVDAVAGITAAWGDITDAIDTLEGVIATDLPDIGAAVRAIPRAIPTDLAEALTIVGAISIPMLRYMSRCGVPNCRNLSSLGRELTNLLDDLAAGAFLALLIGLAADPIGTAHFLNDNVAPIATEAVDGARNLLGV